MTDECEQDEGLAPLRATVADAWRLFGRHAVPTVPLDACVCPCCMAPELEQEMRELPLTALTAKHFYEYNCAAKSEVQPADELLYLLPRMMEVLAEGAEISHSIELSLDRLGNCPRDSFDDAEREVLDRFALAYFERSIGVKSRGVTVDPMSQLLMFDIGGIDIGPLLDVWLQSDTPWSTVHFVRTTSWDFWEKQDYQNAFATDRLAFRQRIRLWLVDLANRRRFADKLLHPDFQSLAARQPATGQVAFSTMVDGVFDNLSQ